jgi:hypothetical protein
LTGFQGPIEKGALDGQTAFGNDLVKALKATVTPRGRANSAFKNVKAGKARRKPGEVGPDPATVAVETAAGELEVDEGISEPLRGSLIGPLFNAFSLFWNAKFILAVIGILLFVFLSRNLNSPQTPTSRGVGYYPGGLTMSQRLAAYEEMRQGEETETELWNWLEKRVGLDRLLRVNVPIAERTTRTTSTKSQTRGQPHQKKSQKLQGLRGRELKLELELEPELDARLNNDEEKMADRELDHAIRATRQRLKVLEEEIAKRKGQHSTSESPSPA